MRLTIALLARTALATTIAGLAVATPAAHAADAPDPANDADRDTIVVTAIHADNAAIAGTKTPLPLAETPQAISVISADDIARLGVTNLAEGLRYVAGVTPETRGANDGMYDLFTLRGFTVDTYLDGLKEFISFSGYAAPQADISRLADIEVVKGPASALYGQSSPGGLVALSSKLPTDQAFYGSVAATYGTYNSYRIDADVGGKLSDNVAARVYGSVNGADAQQTFGRRERQTISAALTFHIDSRTDLTVLGNWSHDPENGNYGSLPMIGSLVANPNGQVPTSFADGERGDFFHRDQQAATYILRHDFDGNWAFKASGRYQHVATSLGAIYQTGEYTDAAETTVGRASYATQEWLSNWTFDNQLSGHIQTGPVRHDILVGVDHQLARSYELAAFGSADDLNVFNPVYGTQAVPTSPYDITSAPYAYAESMQQTGIYAQDAMSWGGLRLMLSGRQDWASNNGVDSHAFTGRVGALYKTAIGLAPYVSYATSFEPQSGQVQASDGTISEAKPSMGKQFEAGVKFQPRGTPLLISADWFHIEETNVLTAIPDSAYSTESGKVRSEGFEIEGTVPLPAGFSLRASYGHQKVRTIADAETPSNVGQPPIGSGDGNLAANLDWQGKDGRLGGLHLGVGLRHVEGVYGGEETVGQQIWTPGYTVVDALARYDLAAWNPRLHGLELSVNVTNLFNRKYLTSCYIYGSYDAWCWYGNRRTAQGTLSWHF